MPHGSWNKLPKGTRVVKSMEPGSRLSTFTPEFYHMLTVTLDSLVTLSVGFHIYKMDNSLCLIELLKRLSQYLQSASTNLHIAKAI